MKEFSEIPLFSSSWAQIHPILFPEANDIRVIGDTVIKNYWDIIFVMENLINVFSAAQKGRMIDSKDYTLVGNKSVYLGKNVLFQGPVIINTEKGPVIIDDNSVIKNFSVIEGPVYIGKNCLIDNAVIHGPVITGKVCKLSGEIEECFIMDYVNKHHYGFLGHSILENWVNLGAGTTNSDLKNNYSNVRMYDGEKYIDTGRMKLGCIIGEHSKTAIGTMINTGTVIGPFCNVFGNILRVKNLPPLSWGAESYKFDIEKHNELLTIVIKRRNAAPDETYLKKIRELYSAYN